MSAPRLLLIDNYDSFTYNLVQAFLILGADVRVHRNDQAIPGKQRPLHDVVTPFPNHDRRPVRRHVVALV